MSQTKIGTTIQICATAQPTDLDQSGFEALTYVAAPVNVVTFPSFGIDENIVSQDYADGGLTKHSKGFKRGQQSSLIFGDLAGDTGQAAFHTASATRSSFALKMTSADGSIRYTRALIGEPTFTGGEGEAFDNFEFPIAIQQKPIIDRP